MLRFKATSKNLQYGVFKQIYLGFVLFLSIPKWKRRKRRKRNTLTNTKSLSCAPSQRCTLIKTAYQWTDLNYFTFLKHSQQDIQINSDIYKVKLYKNNYCSKSAKNRAHLSRTNKACRELNTETMAKLIIWEARALKQHYLEKNNHQWSGKHNPDTNYSTEVIFYPQRNTIINEQEARNGNHNTMERNGTMEKSSMGNYTSQARLSKAGSFIAQSSVRTER